MRNSFLFLICLFLYPMPVLAGLADNYYFRNYSNKDGLSHNTVHCSLQDRKGFMWFGTEDGLNRFDGYSFRVYRYNARSVKEGGLLNDQVVSLFEDSKGRIWICTVGGICYYDYETDLFHTFEVNDQPAPYHSENVLEDKEGYLWFRNYSRIMRYDPESGDTKMIPAEESGFHPVAMIMTEEGTLVFADGRSLYVYKPETGKFERIPVLELSDAGDLTTIQTIREVPQAGFFIGTNRDGLLMYHSGSRRTETVIPDIQVRDIMRFNSNVYWIASESGAYIYSLADKTLLNLRKSLTNNYTISDNAIYSLTKDREGGIWLGSFFGGVDYLSKNYTQFSYYVAGKTHQGMLGNRIREICPDKYGNLWLGTEDNGINCFDLKKNEMVNYSFLNPDRKLSATNIHGLYADGDTLWVGTFNKGIELLHIPTGKAIKRYSRTDTGSGLASDFIVCFLRTRKGEMLVGTSAGVQVFDERMETFSNWKGIGSFVRQILEDKAGNIWVSSTDGVYKYVPGNGREEETVHRYVSDGNQGLGSSNTTSVFEDSKGRIWVTTVYGMSLYDETTDSFDRITADDGLPGNIIYRIVEDGDNFFWVSTANGLVRFHPETRAMHTYTYTDGLHESQFNYSSSYKSPDGTIYMGTINGMISFHPERFKEDTYALPLYITRMYMAGSPEKSIRLLKYPAENPYEVKLPYNAATFTISYIAPGFTSPQAIRYSYMLEGVDKDWIDMGKNREVTFARLSPGKYTFKVRSTNASDVWQENEQSLHIMITPPFWATTWAYVIYLLLIAGGVVLFYLYKRRIFMKRVQREQELFEVEKEKELYNAKIQFFTFITHEIRTPLTLIKAPLEKIVRSDDGNEDTRRNLRMIEKNTQHLLDLSNQLLDFRKTESRGFRLNFVKTNIRPVIENILMPFSSAFQKGEKEFTLRMPDSHLFAFIDRDAFSKIVSNLLTNALKYSEKRICLEVDASAVGDKRFKVVVTNDGYPVPEGERENIFAPFYRLKETEHQAGSGIGLSLSRSLAEFHNGTLVYEATPEGLNRFVLTLPTEQGVYNFEMEKDNPDEPVPAESEQCPEGDNKPVILVVEDQADMRAFISGELSGNYTVLAAGNGKVALEVLEKNPADLIISDVMMPLMDGFELCNEVKNNVQFSHIPFVLLTAQHNLQSRLKGLNKGADAYMEKPFSLELLSAQIENLLRNREILSKAYQEKPSTPPSFLSTSPLDDLFIRKLNDYLEENMTNESLNVEMLATEMGMSTSSLYRKVKGISNLSPVDFIRLTRLKKAVRLMNAGENRISEIAYLVGFSSPAYFSTCFQKQYGKSPSEYMKERGG